MEQNVAAGWFSCLMSVLNSATLLAPGIAALHWPTDVCGALLKNCSSSANSGSEQLHVLLRLWGICLAVAAIPCVIATSMAWVSHHSENAVMKGTSVLLTRVLNGTVTLIWIGLALVVLVEEKNIEDTALYVITGAAGGLGFLNAISLMVSCWPVDRDAPRGVQSSKTVTGRTQTCRTASNTLTGEKEPLLGGGKKKSLKPRKGASTSINGVEEDVDQELHTNLGGTDYGAKQLEHDGDEPIDDFHGVTADSDPAVRIASRSAHRREQEEERAKHARERGYGTFKLLQLARPHKYWLYAGCIVLLIRLPFSLSIPHWVSQTIGALIDQNWEKAKWSITYLVICGTMDSIFDFWCVYLFGLAQQKIIRSLRLDLFAAILRQEIGFFDTTKTGEITSRLTADTAEMANDLTNVFRFTLEAIVRIGGIIGYMFYRSWRLGLLALAIIPITSIINHFYARWLRGNQESVQSALARANSVAEEVIVSIRTVASFAMEAGEHARYTVQINTYYVLVMKQIFMQGVYYMVCNTFLINTCVQAALLAYGTVLVRSPTIHLHPEVLLAFMLYQGQLQEYFQNLMYSFTSLIKSSGAAAKVFEYIDREPIGALKNTTAITAALVGAEPRPPPDLPRPPPAATPPALTLPTATATTASESPGTVLSPQTPMGVRFSDVHFCYPSRRDMAVLRGLSFEARPGEVLALVGSSGSGKSTAFHLIERFYEAQVGVVTIDGRDVTTLDHAWLHQHVALVGQEPTLLSGTIASNIAYGLVDEGTQGAGRGNLTEAETNKRGRGESAVDDPPATNSALHSRIVAAAKEANAHDFIMGLPDGYNTQVGERGVQLSGGQKQRIAIARCLIRSPAILLLDEATSALDAESEAVVQEALERAMANRTTLLIAHRLSTVRNANRIVMMSQGKVVEVGTHDELMAKPDDSTDSGITYRSLVRRQTIA
eukprot:m.1153954 g.1153954  ORF g.1153954 m.1153954 type:complete len:943 (+) comp24487_c0_seq19:419-3247(+)